MSKYTWIRTRVTGELIGGGGRRVCFILGERDDGGVFFQSLVIGILDNEEEKESRLKIARIALDQFLDAPLLERSKGTFEIEPNFYVPGMSPGRI